MSARAPPADPPKNLILAACHAASMPRGSAMLPFSPRTMETET